MPSSCANVSAATITTMDIVALTPTNVNAVGKNLAQQVPLQGEGLRSPRSTHLLGGVRSQGRVVVSAFYSADRSSWLET